MCLGFVFFNKCVEVWFVSIVSFVLKSDRFMCCFSFDIVCFCRVV